MNCSSVVTFTVSQKCPHTEGLASLQSQFCQSTSMQPDALANPSVWASTVGSMSQKFLDKSIDQSALQRKVRAHGNFIEYVPLGLLFIVALELMPSPKELVWLLGGTLTIARIAYAYGVITTYGPSVGRASGFFGTLFVYLVGAIACVYYGFQGVI